MKNLLIILMGVFMASIIGCADTSDASVAGTSSSDESDVVEEAVESDVVEEDDDTANETDDDVTEGLSSDPTEDPAEDPEGDQQGAFFHPIPTP